MPSHFYAITPRSNRTRGVSSQMSTLQAPQCFLCAIDEGVPSYRLSSSVLWCEYHRYYFHRSCTDELAAIAPGWTGPACCDDCMLPLDKQIINNFLCNSQAAQSLLTLSQSQSQALNQPMRSAQPHSQSQPAVQDTTSPQNQSDIGEQTTAPNNQSLQPQSQYPATNPRVPSSQQRQPPDITVCNNCAFAGPFIEGGVTCDGDLPCSECRTANSVLMNSCSYVQGSYDRLPPCRHPANRFCVRCNPDGEK